MRVLIVEDEVKLAAIIRRGMRERGLRADVATSGEDALWMAGATGYGAIVLDVMLPGIDGFETCRRLRSADVWAPVLMLTARDAIADRIAGLDGGADDYLLLTVRRRCELRGGGERVVRKVLERTQRFDVEGRRVDAVVIRDKSYEDGKLVERTFDYFAQSDDGTVHYLSEDVDNIKRGKVVNHRGSWLYGRDTDVLGVAMPADPKVGDQWRFEDVPGVTTESDRVEEVGMRARVHGRDFGDVIRIQEFVQPEGEVEYKLYAPGVG